jgi:polyphosphate kinase
MRHSDSTRLDQPSPKPEGPLPTQHMAATTPIAEAVEVEERFLNRELSWLDFNARVLELAADPIFPLLERVRFCAIFASNLDEFFMIRVAGLLRDASSPAVHAARSTRATLAGVRRRVLELEAQKETVWAQEIEPALAEQGILIAAHEDLDERELGELERSEAEIYPLLTPLAVGKGQPFPHVAGISLNLAALVRHPDSGELRFACVSVPNGAPRFTNVGSRGLLVPIERSIIHLLPRLFPQMEIVEHALFRVTRDADFKVSDEADDLLEAVSLELRRRRFGDVVRLELSAPVSATLLGHLADGLGVEEGQIYGTPGLLASADLEELAALDRPELKDAPWTSRTPARLAMDVASDDMFAEIRRGDILVHHPYDPFSETFERFVTAGARDPNLAAMKTTVYRTSDDSPLVPALVEVAENGRQSVCLVELKARFDEQRNIEWSRALESAGVHVVYGFSDLKIHAKTTLIVRRERERVRRYVHVGTGNYHALTARSYEDFGLFTADEEIAEDISDFFNLITGFGRPESFRKILVAPFNLREQLVEEIRAVARSAAAGEAARVRLKTNAITDQAIVEELYAASQAGARVDIVARSICTLRPGVRGLSENVHVRSVLGRFLEHSRVFLFEAGERSSAYLGSADLMPRNLDHRIEIVVPVEDTQAKAELEAVFEVLLADDTAWVLGHDGAWRRPKQNAGQPRHQSHETLMRRAIEAAQRRSARPQVGLVGASNRGGFRLRGRSAGRGNGERPPRAVDPPHTPAERVGASEDHAASAV